MLVSGAGGGGESMVSCRHEKKGGEGRREERVDGRHPVDQGCLRGVVGRYPVPITHCQGAPKKKGAPSPPPPNQKKLY